MKNAYVGQRGTVRNGQHGKLIEVYTNGALFQADNGARYTVLEVEFIAHDLAPTVAAKAVRQRDQFFSHIGRNGFHYREERTNGRLVSLLIAPIPNTRVGEAQ